MIGNSLGPYKIIEKIGAGGMGEVYLGEDTRLGRKVAIKVLPAEFASDPERLARFEQEARAAAALNNPHIAVVHDIGFEEGDAGAEAKTNPSMDASGLLPASGVHYMVQEYLEGETLREPLDKGRLPLDRALDLATEVGEALTAAHEAGVIHRDLKPENIFITQAGHAKVLDFGLAKLTEVAVTASPGAVSKSPTMLGTVAGQVMGTAGYMAPEQVQGDGNIDHRADLFGMGCVLYEMVTGRKAFAGRNVLDTLGRIVDQDPEPLASADAQLPAELQRIIRKCLAKEPGKRYQGAGDVVVDLEALVTEVSSGAAQPVVGGAPASGHVVGAAPASEAAHAPEARGPAEGVPGAAVAARTGISMKIAIPAAGLLLAIGFAAAYYLVAPTPEPRAPRQFTFGLSTTRLQANRGNLVAISPDGNEVVVRIGTPSGGSLLHRTMNELEVVELPGTDGASSPTFSPDNRWVAYAAAGEIRRVAIAGGRSFTLCDVCGDTRDLSWGFDETILFSNAADGGLYSIPGSGGREPTLVVAAPTEGEFAGHSVVKAQRIPDSNAILAAMWVNGQPGATVVVIEPSSGAILSIAPGAIEPTWVDTGHIAFGRNGTLFVVPFDVSDLAVTGDPVPMVDDVRMDPAGSAFYAIAGDGTLAYISGTGIGGGVERQLVWFDRSGAEVPASQHVRSFSNIRLSPDGGKVAAQIEGDSAGNQIWVLDLATDSLSPLTTDGDFIYPIWTPDGSTITYSALTSGPGLYSQPADFSSDEPVTLLTRDHQVFAGEWSPDGDFLAYREIPPETNRDVWILPADEDGTPQTPYVFRATEASENTPSFSPDTAWLAYSSDVSGDGFEVFARPFPSGGNRVPISSGGGWAPVWHPDGNQIFYLDLQGMLVATVEIVDGALRVLDRQRLFDTPGTYDQVVHRSYSYDPVGDRFLFAKIPGASDTAGGSQDQQVTVVLNWLDEVRRVMDANR